MSINQQQRFHKKPFSQYYLHTDRPSNMTSFMKSSEIISNNKENQDPIYNSNSSIIKEIQEIEKVYQEKIDSLKKLNAKLMSTIEFMEKTLEYQLQEKQLIIMKQQNDISSYRSMLSQNAQVNIKNLKTEIEDEKIKTERMQYELKDFKYKHDKEQPLVHLFKKIEQTQEEYNQQNKIFMREVLQLLDKPRSQFILPLTIQVTCQEILVLQLILLSIIFNQLQIFIKNIQIKKQNIFIVLSKNQTFLKLTNHKIYNQLFRQHLIIYKISQEYLNYLKIIISSNEQVFRFLQQFSQLTRFEKYSF